MRRTCKLTAVLMAVILMIGTLSFGVTANAASPSSGTFNGLQWKYSAGTLTINGSGSTGEKQTDRPWKEYDGEITKVVIGEGITEIGKNFLAYLTSLTEVSLPSTLTKIGDYAFCGDNALTSVTFPDGLTNVGIHAFLYCRALTTINFPKNAHFSAWAFSDCGFTSVTVPDSFEGSLDGYCFMDNKNLTSAHIGKGLQKFGRGLFRGCNQLTKLTISSENPNYIAKDNVVYDKIVREVIFYAPGLPATSFTLPSTIQYIGEYAFDGVEALKKIVLPQYVTELREGCFRACTNLIDINFPDRISKIEKTALEDVPWVDNQPDGLIRIGSIGFLYKGECPETYTLDSKVEDIGPSCFAGQTKLKRINLHDKLVYIRYGAFRGCTALQSIDIPDSVMYIENDAFFECTSVKSVKIGKGVTTLNPFTFSRLYALEELVIPDNVHTLDEHVLHFNTGLKKLTIPKTVNYIGYYAFGFSVVDNKYVPNENLTVYVYKDSKAESYCKNKGLKYVLLDEAKPALNKTAISISGGQLYNLTVSNGTAESWKTSDKKIATVSTKGRVRGLRKGTCVITAVLTDGTELTCKVTVTSDAPVLGDVDTDGSVTILDATAIQRKLASLAVNPYREASADADGDGTVTVLDTNAIQRHLAGLSANDAIGKPIIT